MTESIFRFTDPGDQISTLDASDIIEFNLAPTVTTGKPDGTAKLVAPSFRMARDINFHPNPRKTLDPIQDSLLGILDVEVGYFVNHLSTKGPKNLFNWQVGEADTDTLPVGRFGMDLSSFGGLLSLTPTATQGYYLYDIDIQDIEDPRTEVPFIARFYRSGVINEV